MAHRSLHPLLHYLRRLGGKAGEGPLEDAHLLHRFLAGRDESAFTVIVQRYGAMVWGLCVRRLGETPEAEDAFQATFLVLVRKAASLRGPTLLGPWLYGVANRTTLKLRGKRARQAARETPLPEQLSDERPEQVWAELRPVLDEEINRLPTKYRLPVLLCYLQGLSSEEAAQRLGCAKGTIFSRLSRARDLLRRRLLRRGLDLSAGALAAVLVGNTVLRAAPSLALREMTIRTSLLFAAGTAGQTLSAPVAPLVEGVVRSMFLSKVKFAVIVLLALGLVGSGAGFIAHRTGAEQPASKPAAAPAGQSERTAKAKEKADESKPRVPPPKVGASKPYVPPPAVGDETQRLREWRDKLIRPADFPGCEDPKTTLSEELDQLSKLWDVAFVINERAFRLLEKHISPLHDRWDEEGVRKVKIADEGPIPPMNTSLRTVLRAILDRVDAAAGIGNVHTEVVFLVRKDHIEITTDTFLRMELGIRNDRPVLPLVWDAFEETPLNQILPRVAETSGCNVVADPKAGEKLQTKLTVQLNNVPIDTMAGLSVARLDNVFYVTTTENAKHLREEQAKINADGLMGGAGVAPAPAPEKPAK
jgi:RNA polymerase sigma factor (sigma-70 family)